MPSVILSREEVVRRDLPLVCVCCGAPALSFRRVALSWWFGRVEAPLCMEHHDHWHWRAAVVYLGLAVTGPALVLGFWAMIQELLNRRGGNGLVFFGVALLFFLLLLVVFALVHFTGVRVSHAGADTLTLAGVAPQFLDALREHRQAVKA